MTSNTSASTDQFARRVELIPVAARRLLCLIAREAHHGTLRSKTPGTATLPEVHEACGLDVDAMYSLLKILQDAGFILIDGEYPFETMKLASEIASLSEHCEAAKIQLENVVVDQRFDLLSGRAGAAE